MKIEIDYFKTMALVLMTLVGALWICGVYQLAKVGAKSVIKKARKEQKTPANILLNQIYCFILCVIISLVIGFVVGQSLGSTTIEEPDPRTGAGGISVRDPDVSEKDKNNQALYIFLITVIPSLLGVYIKFRDVKFSKLAKD